MPIPVERLLEAQRPLETRLLEFLEAHKSEAYSLSELYIALGDLQKDPTSQWALALLAVGQRARIFDPFVQALQKLASDGKVTQATVQWMTYYALAQ